MTKNTPSDSSLDNTKNFFDALLDAPTLISSIDRSKIENILNQLLDKKYCLLTSDNSVLCGKNDIKYTKRITINYDLEPIAFLELESQDEDKASLALQILNMLIQSNARYTMASKLHIEAINEDFKRLYIEHQALVTSEAKYKALSEELEQRVKEQVIQIQQAQLKLYESEKMVAIGQLAAGIAHEINNPIGFIQSNLSMLKNYITTISGIKEKLLSGDISKIKTYWSEEDIDFIVDDIPNIITESLQGTARISEIVKSLKLFSNIDNEAVNLIDINELITTAYTVSTGTIKNTIAKDKEISIILKLGDIPHINCMPGYLSQALLNLLLNAAQAINNPSGKILIESKYQDNFIIISIQDDGPGIPKNIINRVCEPFFTTKDVGTGTGLGLSICQDIAKAHNGKLTINSVEGKGTCVSLWLPVSTP